ncbi:rod shape-determining protein RodA [Altererythrobacter ishigakiensis]|uniref:Peptidoglycan glycosyltransferase MrdB n=1 Tax=Altererythrobacter ishigakiensis TaxID=476157 RepID=A0A562UWL0_9SPHN|nr:rod shape-determining protein RodA [Altererythrobacter ishigakiensis]TWJ09983.1 rod shape determining protein RodA [Altererythrobacter ishigakiensis]
MNRFGKTSNNSLIPAPIARQPWEMLIPLLTLVLFGAAVLYSAAGGAIQPFAASHIVRFTVFMVMAAIIASLPQPLVKFLTYPAYVTVLLMLLAVEVVGAIGGGSQRWLDLGFMRLQPSEIMKPVVVLALARFYSSLPPGMVGNWQALVLPGALIAMPMSLVLLQPDLGTSLAIAFGGAIVMLLAGLPVRWFAIGGAIAAVLAPLAFFFGLQEYQQRRVTTFMDPESDPLGAGYHITQSKIAIGSGGLTGKGFNQGSQSHLDYLPEPHTDFVFATMAEEWGLIGGLFVIVMFSLILRWGWRVARASNDRFAMLLAGGATATVFFYIAINLMMVMGLAPVVGIPLPWMSHGGSSMLTNMICVGLLMMVNRWNREAPRRGLH